MKTQILRPKTAPKPRVVTAAARSDALPKARGKRLSRELRKQFILDGAADFFAEFGFDAQMTDLAARIDISHSLIFHYFPTKQSLIEEVYEHVHMHAWSKIAETHLADRSVSLQSRIENFLLAYLDEVDNPRWIRLGLYSGLGHQSIETKRRLTESVSLAMQSLIREVKLEYGYPDLDPDIESEIGWHLYSSMIFWLMRKYVLDRAHVDDKRMLVRTVVANFLHGLRVLGDTGRAEASDVGNTGGNGELGGIVAENARLKRLVAELALQKALLEDRLTDATG